LAELVDDSEAVPPSEEVLAEVRKLADAIDCGTYAERKALLQALVANISVTSRDYIEPFFRAPQPAADAVRAVSALVVLGCHCTNTPGATIAGPVLALCPPNTPMRHGNGDR
jgi:hypothetical protein